MEDWGIRRRFGQAHKDYRSNTPLFFPLSARFLKDWWAPPSWRSILAERELSRLVRHAAYPLLVIITARLVVVSPESLGSRHLVDALLWEGVIVIGAFLVFLILHCTVEKDEARPRSTAKIRAARNPTPDKPAFPTPNPPLRPDTPSRGGEPIPCQRWGESLCSAAG